MKIPLAMIMAVFLACLASSNAAAFVWHINPDVLNNTKFAVNDLEYRVIGASPFTITQLFMVGGSGSAFATATATPLNTIQTDWLITYAGATIFPGQTTHAGFDATSDFPSGFAPFIAQGYWTMDGTRVGYIWPPTVRFNGVGQDFLVVSIKVFDSKDADLPDGMYYFEGKGTDFTVENFNRNNIFVSWGKYPTSIEVPLSDLTLTGQAGADFGAFTPVIELPGVPEPGSLALLCVGLAGVRFLRRRTRA